MTDANFKEYKNRYMQNRELTDFWENLKEGYDAFMLGHKALKVKADAKGDYLFE